MALMTQVGKAQLGKLQRPAGVRKNIAIRSVEESYNDPTKSIIQFN